MHNCDEGRDGRVFSTADEWKRDTCTLFTGKFNKPYATHSSAKSSNRHRNLAAPLLLFRANSSRRKHANDADSHDFAKRSEGFISILIKRESIVINSETRHLRRCRHLFCFSNVCVMSADLLEFSPACYETQTKRNLIYEAFHFACSNIRLARLHCRISTLPLPRAIVGFKSPARLSAIRTIRKRIWWQSKVNFKSYICIWMNKVSWRASRTYFVCSKRY